MPRLMYCTGLEAHPMHAHDLMPCQGQDAYITKRMRNETQLNVLNDSWAVVSQL